MSLLLRSRSTRLERMDVETLGPAQAAQVLRNLSTINHWLGGVRATLWHLKRFAKRWKPGETIRILDWGTGGADIPRAIVRWARARRQPIEITGVDHSADVLSYARQACAPYPEIRLLQGSADEALGDEGFDYVLSSLCLHHLRDEDIVRLLQKSDRLARRGILMNDLKRSARAWAWIWTLSRLTGAHSMVQDDGPLSVRRAFTAPELRAFARKAALPYLRVRTHFGYRLTLAGEKS